MGDWWGRNEQIAAYMEFKYLTGLRKGDILNMKRDQIKPDGIHVQTSKTGKKVIIERTPALDASIARINKLRKVISIYLFSTRTGGKYTVGGFSAIWQRKMVKALDKGIIAERFAEHDLRAKAASDTDLNHAASLLTHDDKKNHVETLQEKGRKSEATPIILETAPNIGNSENRKPLKPLLYGAPGEIRTPDLLVRSQTLYPTELRAHFRGSALSFWPAAMSTYHIVGGRLRRQFL